MRTMRSVFWNLPIEIIIFPEKKPTDAAHRAHRAQNGTFHRKKGPFCLRTMVRTIGF